MVIEKTMSGADIAALGAGAFFGMFLWLKCVEEDISIFLSILNLRDIPLFLLFVFVWMIGALSRYQAGKIASDFIATDPKRFGKLTGWQVQKTIYIMICLYPYVGESQQIN